MTDYGADFELPIPPPPRPVEYADVDASGWWVSILMGVALVVLGVWLLTNLFESVVVLAWLVGISLIVGGLTEIIALGGRDGLGWLAWLGGGLLVIAGIVVLAWPDITLWALAVMAGIGLLAAGLLEVVTALTGRDHPDWPAKLGIGVLGVVAGLLVLAWPEATLVVLALILGIRAVVTGFVAIGVGWQVHRLASR